MTVIPNGIVLPPRPDADAQRRGVVTVGRLHDPGKNTAILKRAAEQLGDRLTLVGPANADDQAGMPEARWTGELDSAAVVRELQQAIVYAAPSLYEPFGLAPLEAAARGCALVLADLPTLREVWADAAWYVDPTDPDDWAEALGHLIKSPHLALEQSERARQRAGRYTADAMVRGYLRLYRHLAYAPAVAALGAEA